MSDVSARPQRIAWFIAVGCSAAAVHWSVVVLLVGHVGWHPLVANLAGWLLAFGVAFVGHHALSFRGHGVGLLRAGRRLALVSAAGFVVNEGLYALLLNRTSQGYDVLLAGVLVVVAVFSYLASRHWVFLKRAAPPGGPAVPPRPPASETAARHPG